MNTVKIDRKARDASRPKFPEIKVRLTGKNGNAFNIIGAVQHTMRIKGVSDEEVNEFMKEATAGDYNALLATCMRWVNVS